MQRLNITIDCETLSLADNPLILSFGAYCIELDESFYVNIDPIDCQKYNLHIDASTVMWWLHQSDDARKALFDKPTKLVHALKAFDDWMYVLGFGPEDYIWGYGAIADLKWMNNLYYAAGLTPVWNHRQEMCGRTVKQLTGVNPILEGTAHNALDDAKWLAEILKESGLLK